jgi:ATP-dependent RNA helicase SUPV3L1/SUV3
VQVANHYVGRLQGFRFFPDTQAEGIHGKAARSAATHVLAKELAMRARRVAAAKNDALKLRRGQILWRDEEIGRLEAGDDLLKPIVVLSADDAMSAGDKEKVQERLSAWVAETIGERLKPLVEIANAKDLTGLARGIAFRLSECMGVLRREAVAEEMRSLDQPARAQLRSYGVRFGAFNIYFPALLKPAAIEFSFALWLLKHGAQSGLDPSNPPALPRPGLTSVLVDPALPEAFYHVAGFHPCGTRAVRIDILERLADQIRPLVAWRPDPANPAPPPKGATGDGGFRVTPDMMSILGCSSSDMGEILHKLGFRLERVPVAQGEEKRAAEAADAPGAEAPAADAVAAAEVTAAAETTVLAEVALPGVPASDSAGEAGSPAAEPVDDSATAQADVVAQATPAEEDTPSVVEAPTQSAPVEAPAASQADKASEKPQRKTTAEPRLDEIWRPRRQGRHHDRGRPRRRFAAPGEPAKKDEAQPRRGGKEARPGDGRHKDGRQHKRPDRPDHRQDRSERRQGHGGARGDERPQRSFRHSASPAPKPGIDPDSPFAALSSLKAALEKQGQE